MRNVRFALVILPVFCAHPALAGPRDAALSGISRCAALPDDRTFLDCVYGAVQPLRAELGLPPALAAQQRLVPPLDPSLARNIQPPAAQSPGEPSQQSQGMFSGMFAMSLHMVSYSFDRRGLFTVTLSDGSVWRQDPNDTNVAHFAGKPTAYAVSVHNGDYGKAKLAVRGEPGLFLVDRIR